MITAGKETDDGEGKHHGCPGIRKSGKYGAEARPDKKDYQGKAVIESIRNHAPGKSGKSVQEIHEKAHLQHIAQAHLKRNHEWYGQSREYHLVKMREKMGNAGKNQYLFFIVHK